MPQEVPLAEDVKDWAIKLTDADRSLLTHIFRFFTQSDIEVQDNYMSRLGQLSWPTEVKMMLVAFANMESIHIDAYSLLIETIGMPEQTYSQFMEYDELKKKHETYQNFTVDSVENIAKTLAMFGGFAEGVQLFASFAVLMNFPRFNKMKGMGQIVSWSVRDECVSADTEVLTPKGWVRFSNLKDGESVAQFDPKTRLASFVIPNRVVRKPYKGIMHCMDKRGLSMVVTPNHDILEEGGQKTKASLFVPHSRKRLPTTGILSNNNKLSALDRLHLAYAADGVKIFGENRTGEKCGYVRATISAKKSRKIERLIALCGEAEIRYNQIDNEKHTVDFPFRPVKDFSSWVIPANFTGQRGRDLIEEVLQWDGHVTESRKIFCSTLKSEIDCLQAIAALSGLSTTLTISEDSRKDSYKDYYRLSFWDQAGMPCGKMDEYDYDGIVYCVSVPTGSFYTRLNNKVVITGNSLHCDGISELFRAFVQETGCLTRRLKKEIYDIAELVIQQEDKFIDLAFSGGAIEGLTPEELQHYTRYLCDFRLRSLGLKPIFKTGRKHPLPWLTPLLSGPEHSNFFEARATEYSKAATQGSWGDVKYD